MNGFGSKVYTVSQVVIEDIFKTGRPIKLLRLSGDHILAEVDSAARAVDKTGDRLIEWASIRDPYPIRDCVYRGEKVKGVAVSDYVAFLESERETDNPYAEQAMGRGVSAGVDYQLKKAIASGLDYIEMPTGDRIHFEVIDGQPYLSMDDFAQALGLTSEEMEEGINSEEFKALRRNSWD